MLCFAGQNESRKMDGEACPADGFGTRSFELGSCSDRRRIGTASLGFIFAIWTFKIWRRSRTKALFWHLQLSLFVAGLAQKLRFRIFHFHFLREVSHGSFVLTSSTFTFWRRSRTKASFSHLPLSLFEGGLARKLRSHIFHCHFLREVSHKSFVLTASTFTWRKSRTKASFSHLQLSFFEGGLARKLCFRIFNFHFLRDVSHKSFVLTSSTFTFWGRSCTKASFSHLQLSLFEGNLARNAFLRVSGCTKCYVLQDKTSPGRWMGKLVRRTVSEHVRLNWDHARIGGALELPV